MRFVFQVIAKSISPMRYNFSQKNFSGWPLRWLLLLKMSVFGSCGYEDDDSDLDFCMPYLYGNDKNLVRLCFPKLQIKWPYSQIKVSLATAGTFCPVLQEQLNKVRLLPKLLFMLATTSVVVALFTALGVFWYTFFDPRPSLLCETFAQPCNPCTCITL